MYWRKSTRSSPAVSSTVPVLLLWCRPGSGSNLPERLPSTQRNIAMTELIAVGVAALVVGGVAGFVMRVMSDRASLQSTSKRAETLEEEGRQKAGQFLKEAEVKAKEEALKLREDFEREARTTRDEFKDQERRQAKQADSLERRADVVTKKEKYVEGQEKNDSDGDGIPHAEAALRFFNRCCL